MKKLFISFLLLLFSVSFAWAGSSQDNVNDFLLVQIDPFKTQAPNTASMLEYLIQNTEYDPYLVYSTIAFFNGLTEQEGNVLAQNSDVSVNKFMKTFFSLADTFTDRYFADVKNIFDILNSFNIRSQAGEKINLNFIRQLCSITPIIGEMYNFSKNKYLHPNTKFQYPYNDFIKKYDNFSYNILLSIRKFRSAINCNDVMNNKQIYMQKIKFVEYIISCLNDNSKHKKDCIVELSMINRALQK